MQAYTLKTAYKTLNKNTSKILTNNLLNIQNKYFTNKNNTLNNNITSDITNINTKNLITTDTTPIINISYLSDHQDPLKDYKVAKLPPQCGVEDFYPTGKPPLPNPKEIQNTINEYIQTEAKNGNEKMQNKFVCIMTDKHFDKFKEICESHPVTMNIETFNFKKPTEEEVQKVFNRDAKNGNLIYAVCDAKEKKVLGCLGIRFHTTTMPAKQTEYKEMIVPEIWSRMSIPKVGMSSLLRKLQTEVQKDFPVIFAKIPCNNNLSWQPHSEKIFKTIQSFILPAKSGGINMQTYYGYGDKTKDEISKEEHKFLNTMCAQIVNTCFPNAEQSTNKNTTEMSKGRF